MMTLVLMSGSVFGNCPTLPKTAVDTLRQTGKYTDSLGTYGLVTVLKNENGKLTTGLKKEALVKVPGKITPPEKNGETCMYRYAPKSGIHASGVLKKEPQGPGSCKKNRICFALQKEVQGEEQSTVKKKRKVTKAMVTVQAEKAQASVLCSGVTNSGAKQKCAALESELDTIAQKLTAFTGDFAQIDEMIRLEARAKQIETEIDKLVMM